MNKKIIISDAGPLIILAKINYLSVLTEQFSVIQIPQSVANEGIENIFLPGAGIIKQAIENKLIEVQADPELSVLDGALNILGPGEAAAIRLAYLSKNGLLIDEKRGRKIAKNLNLNIIGTAGILYLAKKKKIIKTVKPIIELIKKENYHLSDKIIEDLLLKTNESVL